MFGIEMTFEARLGADPELRYMPTGDAVASARAAVDNGTNQRSKEKLAATWLELSAWGDLAEQFQHNYRKGDLLRFTGKLTQRTYEDREGKTVAVLGCRVKTVDPVFPGDGRYASRHVDLVRAGAIPDTPTGRRGTQRFHRSYRGQETRMEEHDDIHV